MRASVASAFFFVACCGFASSALADSLVGQVTMVNRQDRFGPQADASRAYWSGSSEYYIANAGITLTGTPRAPRHVLISGYHPVSGFGPEIAQETAAVAAHRAR